MNTVLKRPAGIDVKIHTIRFRFSTRTIGNYGKILQDIYYGYKDKKQKAAAIGSSRFLLIIFKNYATSSFTKLLISSILL